MLRVLSAGLVFGLVEAQSRWNCPSVTPPPAPKTIADLHPAHVEIFMAMGDSITAAFAARSDIYEARDISWAIGTGTSDQLTLPWMMSQFNGNKTTGSSTEKRIPRDPFDLPHNDWHPETDHMNVAESEGAVHRGSMSEQWGFLSNTEFKKYPDFDNKWKVLTVWMMANDVCGAGDDCKQPISQGEIDVWRQGYDDLLANVTKTLTKTYINLVSTLDLSNVARLQRSVEYCKLEHKYIVSECGCIDKGDATQLKQLDENVHTLNNELHNITATWGQKFKDMNRTDLAIVTQSFQEGIGSSLTIDFLNKLDCFHPSTVGHEDLAIGLWNSMLCVNDRKNRCNESFTPDMPVTCPTSTSVFYTGPDVIPNPPTI